MAVEECDGAKELEEIHLNQVARFKYKDEMFFLVWATQTK